MFINVTTSVWMTRRHGPRPLRPQCIDVRASVLSPVTRGDDARDTSPDRRDIRTCVPSFSAAGLYPSTTPQVQAWRFCWPSAESKTAWQRRTRSALVLARYVCVIYARTSAESGRTNRGRMGHLLWTVVQVSFVSTLPPYASLFNIHGSH